jgi:hypothetical protein
MISDNAAPAHREEKVQERPWLAAGSLSRVASAGRPEPFDPQVHTHHWPVPARNVRRCGRAASGRYPTLPLLPSVRESGRDLPGQACDRSMP